jgi:hypothetical protein
MRGGYPMRLTTKAQAEAFIFFMLNEKNRHLDDIRQIEGTVAGVAAAFGITELPVLDPKQKYWVEVSEIEPAIRMYPPNPINADEG